MFSIFIHFGLHVILSLLSVLLSNLLQSLQSPLFLGHHSRVFPFFPVQLLLLLFVDCQQWFQCWVVVVIVAIGKDVIILSHFVHALLLGTVLVVEFILKHFIYHLLFYCCFFEVEFWNRYFVLSSMKLLVAFILLLSHFI